MEIIVLTKSTGAGRGLCIGPTATRLLFVLMFLLSMAFILIGFRLGGGVPEPVALEQPASDPSPDLGAAFAENRRRVAQARRFAEENLDALALQLGQMEARLIRLDTVGSRLVDMAKLDAAEFGFGQDVPAMGGPNRGRVLESQTMPELIQAFEKVARELDEQEQALSALEKLLMQRRLVEAIEPSGRPVTKGWISSYFGRRTDPVTGKKAYHDGLDFAGKRGTGVVAVAAGVVTWSGARSGYGNLVEINHGNGLVTRYAHNDENVVEVGDRVDKGQVIARLGSTGRTTGPHVHFELLKNGKAVNPLKYVKAEG